MKGLIIARDIQIKRSEYHDMCDCMVNTMKHLIETKVILREDVYVTKSDINKAFETIWDCFYSRWINNEHLAPLEPIMEKFMKCLLKENLLMFKCMAVSIIEDGIKPTKYSFDNMLFVLLKPRFSWVGWSVRLIKS